jgi:NDP-sugar pyrophosphorylase family protein
MAPAAGKPFLEYLVEWLAAQGFADLIFCLGYRAGQVRDHFGDGRPWGVRITYALEAEPLGTAGAIKNAENHLSGPFLVLNGDSYLEIDLAAMVAAHQACRAADGLLLGTLAAVHLPDASAAGALDLNSNNRVRRFREKGAAGPAWVNGGIYLLEPEIMDLIPAGRDVSIERQTFPLALRRDWYLFAYPVSGFFVDIGTPDGYRRFQNYVSTRDLKERNP